MLCLIQPFLLGDLYFEKAVNGFLSDLFTKWKVCASLPSPCLYQHAAVSSQSPYE